MLCYCVTESIVTIAVCVHVYEVERLKDGEIEGWRD